ncbi:MAG: hypothetical protein OEY93_02030 [Anaerolineae bacterium]|nr:hypothetical protein [Anaerolineae bacterium]
MRSRQRNFKLFLGIAALLLLSMACKTITGGLGSSDGGSNLAATQASMEATQAAMSGGNDDNNDADDSSGGAPQGDTGGDLDASAYGPDEEIYTFNFDSEKEWKDRWSYEVTPSSKTKYTVELDSGLLYTKISESFTNINFSFNDLFMGRNDSDVYVELSFDNIGSVRTNKTSILCRVNEDGAYIFSVSSNGLWFIYKYTSSNAKRNVLVEGGVPNYNKNITAHTIGASCIGEELSFYYDGEVLKNGVYQDRDSIFREGSVGFALRSEDIPGVEVEFEYFKVVKK